MAGSDKQGGKGGGARKKGRNFRIFNGQTSSIGSITRYVSSGGPGRHWRKAVKRHGTLITHDEGSGRVIRIHQGYDPATKKGCSISNPCPDHARLRDERVKYA